jgi:hypothetical protein
VTVTFTPTASVARSAAISLADNVAGSPEVVQLSGIGSDFALRFNTNFQNVTLGSTATFQMTVTSEGGFNGPVTFTCNDAPAPWPCTVTPNGVTLNGGSANATVTLVTTASSVAPPSSAKRLRGIPSSGLQPTLALTAVAFLVLMGTRRKARADLRRVRSSHARRLD